MVRIQDTGQQRLEEARSAARKRSRPEREFYDWPKAGDVSLDEALDELQYAMLLYGARISFGCTDGTGDIWCRVSYPKSADSPHAGMIGFVTSDTLAKVMCKASQLLPPTVEKVWTEDRYARD